MVRTFGRLMKDLPTWLLVFLFLVLALVFAFLGVLDDWARAVLALTFAAIAVTLAARFHLTNGTMPPPPPAQPAPYEQPPED